MDFNYFSFDGQNLKDFGFIIKKKPEYDVSEKDYTSEEIPGKSGNALSYHGRFKNRSVTYTIMSLPTRVHCSNRDLLTKIVRWLNMPTDYTKFTDSFNEGLYTEAFCSKIAKVQNHMEGVIEADVTFELKPFWYIDNDIEINNADNNKEFVLQNPTGYPCFPRVVVHANLSSRSLGFTFTDKDENKTSLSLPIMGEKWNRVVEVIYDSETGDILIDGSPFNYLIANFDYPPHFSTGENKVKISYKAKIPYVLIEPRWRIL